jgi:hypothetical protein
MTNLKYKYNLNSINFKIFDNLMNFIYFTLFRNMNLRILYDIQYIDKINWLINIHFR